MNNLVNYGQHFLTDQKVVKQFLVFCDLFPSETVLEIGSGQGVLTKELVKKTKSVTALEIDKRLKPILDKLAKQHCNLTVIYQNVLKLQTFDHNLICGSLSYALFEPLIIRLIRRLHFQRAVFLVSDKVRLSCEKKQGLLYYLLNSFFTVEFGARVLPQSFNPKPRTAGVIVRLIPAKVVSEEFQYWRKQFLFNKKIWQQTAQSLQEINP